MCSIGPIEITAGADAYLGYGASEYLGLSFDPATFELRGVSSNSQGYGLGGGGGLQIARGDRAYGYTESRSITGAYGPVSISGSPNGPSAGAAVSPKIAPKVGVWGSTTGKYTTPATPNLTGMCQ